MSSNNNYYNNKQDRNYFRVFQTQDNNSQTWKQNSSTSENIAAIKPNPIDSWWNTHPYYQRQGNDFMVYSDKSTANENHYVKRILSPGILQTANSNNNNIVNFTNNSMLKSKNADQNMNIKNNQHHWSSTPSKIQFEKPTSISPDIVKQLLNSSSSNNDNSDTINDLDKNSDPLNSNHTKGTNGLKYITDSIYLMSTINNTDEYNNTSIKRPYTVIKVSNIPWGISTDHIKQAFQSSKHTHLPSESELPQAIHVLMDIKTGKTMGVAYAEVKFHQNYNKEELKSAINDMRLLCTQGRRAVFQLSSYEELCNDLFPCWKGEFKNGKAIPITSQMDQSVVNRSFGDSVVKKNSNYFIDQKDLQSLLTICRHFKVHYNRKCPERPFEYMISIIMNIPWKQSKTVTTIQRDIIYECYKLVTDALRAHTNKPLHSFDESLLERLIRAALLCDGFTVKQKSGILANADLNCPEDLQIYLQDPPLMSDKEFTFLH